MPQTYLDHDFLAKLSGIPLEARQGMSGLVSGRHRSVHRGSSIEFAEYRKYVPGDDTKRLDWKAFARSDKFFVKEFEADTNLRAYMVIDASASMAFASEGFESKYDRACKIAANLSYLAIGQGDAVGMVLSKEKREEMEDKKESRGGLFLYVPPSRRPTHIRELMSQMHGCSPTGKTSLVDDLHKFAEKITGRGLVCVFSDLFVDTDQFKDALRHLKFRKHDVVVFHFVDDVEIDLSIDRPVRFVDMEGNAAIVAEPALIKDEYRATVGEFLSGVKNACANVNGDYFLIRNSDSWQDVLTRFLMGRMRRKK